MGDLLKIDRAPDLSRKKVLVRIDSDVDLSENGEIIDDTRLSSSLDTIRFLLDKNATVILIGHLGRPDEKIQSPTTQIPNTQREQFTLLPIAKWYEEKFGGKILEQTTGEFIGWKITDRLFLLENIRFYEGEEKNDPEFAKLLSALGDMYVNEAFAVSHRAHASITGLLSLLPSYAGLHLAKEVEVLTQVMENPGRPFAVLIGGAKIETKLPMVEKMHEVADFVLVGGEIAEQDRVLLHVQHEKVPNKKSILLVAEVKEDKFDITDKSTENFIQVLQAVSTIVWNGPVGVIGKEPEYEKGTRKLAEAISESSAYKVVGGGDTLAFLKRENLLSRFDFVSTGGGAMLEFLSGKPLPGIAPLVQS